MMRQKIETIIRDIIYYDIATQDEKIKCIVDFIEDYEPTKHR